MFALGAAAASQMGYIMDWAAYLLGQLAVTSTQLMAHYLNEYYDREVDRLTAANRTWFSGGSGILSEGVLSPAAVLTAARICAGVALLLGLLASLVSIWMIPIIAFSLLGSWFYSAPPISLMSSGWGELTTSLIVALLVPLAGYCMQGGFPPGGLWLLCIPLILVHTAMIISFEFPDYSADRSAGKRTLTVRLGPLRAAWVVTGLIVAAYLFLVAQASLTKSVPWTLWTFPLAIGQFIQIHWIVKSPTRIRYYLLTAGGVGLFGLMAIFNFGRIYFSLLNPGMPGLRYFWFISTHTDQSAAAYNHVNLSIWRLDCHLLH